MGALRTAETWFLAANRWALILILGTMAVIVFANVVLRYATSQSIDWAEEVARHLMIWLTFLGCGPVLRCGGHIAVENLQDGIPRPLAVALRVAIFLLLALLFAGFVWFGVEYMGRNQHQMTAATQIPFAWVYAALPLGAANALVHLLLIARGYVLERRFASDDGFDATASASL